MRLALVPAPRRLPLTRPACVVLVCWACLVFTAWLLDQLRGTSTPTCIFRAVTGVPCPTCGATRCALRLAHADFVGAWAFNPFITVTLIVLSLYFILKLGFGRTLDLGLSHRQQVLAWSIVGVLLLVNWAYVLKHHGAH